MSQKLVQRRTRIIDDTVPNYYTHHDFINYVTGSVVIHEGCPYYIDTAWDDSGEHVMAALNDVKDYKLVKKIPIDELNISSPELGYCNFPLTVMKHGKPEMSSQVIYLKRHPYKKWKQGVNQSNTTSHSIDGISMGYDFLHNQGFKDSLMGLFPDVDEALEITSGDVSEVAVSPEIAIRKELFGVYGVFFKTQGVGYLPISEKEVVLTTFENDWIVKEYFEELGWKIKS